MRLLKSVGRAAARAVLHPVLWGTALVLICVVVVSLSVARYVIAPAIFASNDPPQEPLTSWQSGLVGGVRQQKPQRLHKRLVSESDTPVKITLVSTHRPVRKWHRHRKHMTPDVIFHAPTNAPSFADAVQRPQSLDHVPSDNETDKAERDNPGGGDNL